MLLRSAWQVGVYDGEWASHKPPVGSGLNKPAVVTLLAVWPEGQGQARSSVPVLSPAEVRAFEADLKAYARYVVAVLLASLLYQRCVVLGSYAYSNAGRSFLLAVALAV
jgi:hypothetical protein